MKIPISPASCFALLIAFSSAGAQGIHIATPSGPVDSLFVPIQGNSTGIVKPMWYEVRAEAKAGAIVDFGAVRTGNAWFCQVRHLAAGKNVVSVFGENGKGITESASVTLLVPESEPIDPRPRPAEIWWGGLGRNEQLIDPARRWDYVKKYADGFFFHGAYWSKEKIERIGPSLGRLLAESNTKCAIELGGQQYSVRDPESTAVQYRNNRDSLQRLWAAGIAMTEVTHDYGIDFEPLAVYYLDKVNPAADAGEVLKYGVHQLWGDGYFRKLYSDFPNIKPAQTTSAAWRWYGDFPPCNSNESDYASTTEYTEGVYVPLYRNREWLKRNDPKKTPYLRDGKEVSMKFNLRDVIDEFVAMSRNDKGKATFAFYSDYPYAHMRYGGLNSEREVRSRQVIRAIERNLHQQGALHTFVCNNGPDGSAELARAQQKYCEDSLNSMILHQIEGGRADRYLFESWYFHEVNEEGKKSQSPFPVWVSPESQSYSYTWLAAEAVRFLKGIRDENGSLETLKLTVIAEKSGQKIRLENTGSSLCLPAITAVGESGLFTRWEDAEGKDITAALHSPEGWTANGIVKPGEAVMIRRFVESSGKTSPVRLRAFWNPQDPTGRVRDQLQLP